MGEGENEGTLFAFGERFSDADDDVETGLERGLRLGRNLRTRMRMQRTKASVRVILAYERVLVVGVDV